LYEQGEYKACIEAICKAWVALSKLSNLNGQAGIPLSNQLAVKLATRLAKANLHTFFDYTGSMQEESTDLAQIEVEKYALLERSKLGEDAKVTEMQLCWMQWRKVKSNSCDAMQKMALVEQAKTHLRALPIFKSPL